MDTSAFVAGFDPFSTNSKEYTVPAVKEEIAENSLVRVRFRIAVENGKLEVRAPQESFIVKANESATLVGDKHLLSEADLQVLALGLELKAEGHHPLIVTDDYSIQNVADQMGIEFESLATFGIRFQLQWSRYCPACHRKYPADYKHRNCEICGTELKRKPLKRKLLKP